MTDTLGDQARAKELWWSLSQSERERLSVLMSKPNVGEPVKKERGYYVTLPGGAVRWFAADKVVRVTGGR